MLPRDPSPIWGATLFYCAYLASWNAWSSSCDLITLTSSLTRFFLAISCPSWRLSSTMYLRWAVVILRMLPRWTWPIRPTPKMARPTLLVSEVILLTLKSKSDQNIWNRITIIVNIFWNLRIKSLSCYCSNEPGSMDSDGPIHRLNLLGQDHLDSHVK